MNSREFRQRIQEIVAPKTKELLNELSRKNHHPQTQGRTKSFRQRIQDIVQRQQSEAGEAGRQEEAASFREAADHDYEAKNELSVNRSASLDALRQ